MNYNIIGYAIYLLFTFTIIVYVGKLCYRHGKIYSLQIFNGNEELTNRTNSILLLCYYLFNLGYCLLTIYSWETINTWKACMENICMRAGFILISIGILHLINIGAIIFISQKKNILHH